MLDLLSDGDNDLSSIAVTLQAIVAAEQMTGFLQVTLRNPLAH